MFKEKVRRFIYFRAPVWAVKYRAYDRPQDVGYQGVYTFLGRVIAFEHLGGADVRFSW